MFLAVILGSCIIASTVFAGTWQKDGIGWWYQNDDGSYPVLTWITDTDGGRYFFDCNGYIVTGTRVIDGETCTFDSNDRGGNSREFGWTLYK